jgi:UDP-N-acetylmuramoyl-tripeptide--D-alanyl-D-alanine ligase
MAAALETFAELASAAPRRVLILGDMLELGQSSPELHREVGRQIVALDARTSIALAMFIGEQSAFAAAEVARAWPAERVIAFSAVDAATMANMKDQIQPGDAILLKASRGMGLERLLESIESALGPSAGGHRLSAKSGMQWEGPIIHTPLPSSNVRTAQHA